MRSSVQKILPVETSFNRFSTSDGHSVFATNNQSIEIVGILFPLGTQFSHSYYKFRQCCRKRLSSLYSSTNFTIRLQDIGSFFYISVAFALCVSLHEFL